MPESASSCSSGDRLRRAVGAIHPHQPLRQDAVQRRNKTVGINSHVHEATDHIKHIVGMHRGKHQVAGQRGLYGDLRGFGVADLAHHDLVRVMAQDGAQAAREGQPFLLVDRNLQYARQLVFNRILDGDDLVLPVVDLGNRRIQRRGFAPAGGAGDQEHAVGLAGDAAIRPSIRRQNPDNRGGCP